MNSINYKSKEIVLPCLNDYLFLNTNENINQKQDSNYKTYNQEFYTTLNTLNQVKLPSIKSDFNSQNYFYDYKSNENAAVTSNAGQVYTTIEEAYRLNMEIKKESIEIKNMITTVKDDIEDIDSINELKGFIGKIRNDVQKFLVEQKTESFKLVKEIAILTKDKIDLQLKIKQSLEKIKRLEEEVGIRETLHNNAVDEMIKGHFVSDNRFYEKENSIN